jgi:hypothetical protein
MAHAHSLQFNVDGYPTLLLVRFGRAAEEYGGPLEPARIALFLDRQALPMATRLLGREDGDAFVARCRRLEQTAVVVAVAAADAEQAMEAVEQAAVQGSDDNAYAVIVSEDAELVGKLAVARPRTFDDLLACLRGSAEAEGAGAACLGRTAAPPASLDSMGGWIARHDLPLLAGISEHNAAVYLAKRAPLCYMYLPLEPAACGARDAACAEQNERLARSRFAATVAAVEEAAAVVRGLAAFECGADRGAVPSLAAASELPAPLFLFTWVAAQQHPEAAQRNVVSVEVADYEAHQRFVMGAAPETGPNLTDAVVAFLRSVACKVRARADAVPLTCGRSRRSCSPCPLPSTTTSCWLRPWARPPLGCSCGALLPCPPPAPSL